MIQEPRIYNPQQDNLDYENRSNDKKIGSKQEDLDSLFRENIDNELNNNNESSNSSRNSTITSYNWIRRSFEDLDIEVVQTEIMQKRKRKESNQQLTLERKHPTLSFSSSLNSEDFHYKDGRNSKDVPYGDKDASNCFECRRMLGQVIDDANGMTRQSEASNYPCECPMTEILCCDNCCSSSNDGFNENEDVLMVCQGYYNIFISLEIQYYSC